MNQQLNMSDEQYRDFTQSLRGCAQSLCDETAIQPRVGTVCDLKMDADLKMVMEFMQSNMSAARLVGVAQALASVAPILWGRYEREDMHALVLQYPPIGRGSKLQSAASE